MSPRTEALAYRIWCYADPRGWDVTLHDVAEAVGCNYHTALNICRYKGWLGRTRPTKIDRAGFRPTLRPSYDGLLNAGAEDMFEGLA